MSQSTQSQEAIAAIDDELHAIMRTENKSHEEDDGSSTDTDTELKWGEEEDQSKKEKEQTDHSLSGKKRTREERKNKLTSIVDLRALSDSSSLSVELDMKDLPNASPKKKQKPVMERTKSLEAIGKYPPLKIVKVCIEKTTQLLEESSSVADQQQKPRDYKKIKYWLKIAEKMNNSIDKANEFSAFLVTVRTEYASKDSTLASLLDSTFPTTKDKK